MSPADPFALGTFRLPAGTAFPGLVVDREVFDLTLAADLLGVAAPFTVRDLLDQWDVTLPVLTELAARVFRADPDNDAASIMKIDDLTVLAPLEPRQVLQSGANYRTHVIDLAVAHGDIAGGRTVEQVRAETTAMMDERVRSGTPYIFLGLPAAVTGPYDVVDLPPYSDQHDWELELAAVIGRRAFAVDAQDALDHVAGYTIVNDLTTRDLVFRKDMREIGTDWYRAKNAPGFLPTGPYVVPAAFVGDTADLRVTLALNGQLMQDESTKDMIFDVATLISAASQISPLLPGDLVLTGSPAGNGIHWGRLLRDGDVMDCSITGLGNQRTVCRAGQPR